MLKKIRSLISNSDLDRFHINTTLLQVKKIMTNKIIKYTLYPDGTVPEYIADGGYYGKSNGGTAPQDFDFIGATIDGSRHLGLGELTSEANVKTYLDTYTSTWKIRNEDNPNLTVDFDQDASAAYIWGKKIA